MNTTDKIDIKTSKKEETTTYRCQCDGGMVEFIHQAGDHYIVVNSPLEDINNHFKDRRFNQQLRQLIGYPNPEFDCLTVKEAVVVASTPILKDCKDILAVVMTIHNSPTLSRFSHTKTGEAELTTKQLIRGICKSNSPKLLHFFTEAMRSNFNRLPILEPKVFDIWPAIEDLPLEKIETLDIEVLKELIKKQIPGRCRQLFPVSDDNYCLLINELKSEFADLAKMLSDYQTPATIPAQLRDAFPEGLKPPRSWKTGKELHDKVAEDYVKITTVSSSRPISYCRRFQPLGDMVGDGWQTVLPTSTTDLSFWGKNLSNCISSYAEQAYRQEVVLLGVKVDDEIRYALELDPNSLQIRQFKGHRNCDPPAELKQQVESAIADRLKSADYQHAG